MKITSKAQQGFLGRISRMKKNTTGRGPSPRKAKVMLEENRGQMRNLPARAPRRSNYRSGGR